MPRSRESLLDATASQGEENRLTELFATVLDTHDGLAAALFKEVGLPVGARFQVFTQVQVGPGSRPDMLIHALDRGGAVVSRIWSEHKVDAGFGDLQRERYLKGLRALPGQGELIFVVRDAPTARGHGDWRGFTWQEVGELIDGVGREWGGGGWRTRAVAPDAPARERLLYELLWYLEEKDLAVAHPLDSDKLLAYKLMDETALAVDALLERAAQNAAPLVPKDSGDESDNITLWQQFETPDGSWLHRFARFECAAELVVSDRAYWSPDQLDEPAFGAGYCFEAALHPALSARRDWVRKLDAADYCCELWADWVRVYKTLAMREVIAFGDTLYAQARGLGEWTWEAVNGLHELDPGDVELPGKTRATGRRVR